MHRQHYLKNTTSLMLSSHGANAMKTHAAGGSYRRWWHVPSAFGPSVRSSDDVDKTAVMLIVKPDQAVESFIHPAGSAR